MNQGERIVGTFANPQEEIAYMQERIAKRKEEMLRQGGGSHVEAVVEEVGRYGKEPSERLLTKGHNMLHGEVEIQASHVASQSNEEALNNLVEMFTRRGLRNTLSVLEKLNNPHLEDEFHRTLVHFFHTSKEHIKVKRDERRSLDMVLFEVLLPGSKKSETERVKELKNILSAMEQFFAGMLSVNEKKSGDNYFSLEIANTHGNDETVFYVAVPSSKSHLFEKQLISIYPHAKLQVIDTDYNIFNPDGVAAGSYAKSARNPIFPLKTYEQFDYDPLNIILNSFSKISRHGEGASIQFIVKPVGDTYAKYYNNALKQIGKGTPLKTAIDIRDTFLGDLAKDFKELVFPVQIKKEEEGKKSELTKLELDQVEFIKQKISSPIVLTNIRIMTSAADSSRAEHILSDIESGFNQFDNTTGNNLTFKRVSGTKLKKLERDFIFRNFSFDIRLPLSLKEVATVMHFAHQDIESAPQLKISRAGSAPAPLSMPQTGVILGSNRYRDIETVIHMTREDRMRHFYTIGQTGTGKSTLIKNMAIQDIKNGDGVCFMDPHGVDVQDILAAVPPERYDDVIYFDPSHTARPMALNMLEYDRSHPEQKTFVVNEMLSIFEKLFDMKVAGGPMFEQYFRNATMLVIEDPDTGATLLEVSRVLADKKFRDLKLANCKNPIVVQFWKEVAEKAGGEASLANMVPYITSKFDIFLSNEIMRPIIGQEKSAFNFREIMDGKKILLVNLAKGKLGDINSYLIGLILVGKILMAALSRVDSLGSPLSDFYLYIDEFQNVTTPSIATILSEARKYRLSLNLAHQFIAQLDEKTRDAVFGNVGSIAAFRVGAQDAEFLEKQFTPVFTTNDLMNIENRNAYVKMLVNGQPVKPFSMQTMSPPVGNPAILEKLKELSYLTYGAPRELVEADVARRYARPTPTSASVNSEIV